MQQQGCQRLEHNVTAELVPHQMADNASDRPQAASLLAPACNMALVQYIWAVPGRSGRCAQI